VTGPTVCVIGLGRMGAPMARNLARSGFKTLGWSRSAPRLDYGPNFRMCADATEALAQSGIIILMLSDASAVDDFLFVRSNLSALRPGSIVIDMGTSGPVAARRQAAALKDAGVMYIDAPVSGGVRGAEAANLTILVGGDAAVFARASKVLAALGTPHLLGAVGAGQTAKLANQIIVAGYIAAVSEALVFAEAQELSPALLVMALQGGFADSPVLRQHGEKIARRNFVAGGAAKLHLKDMNLVAEAAGEEFATLTNTAEARRRFDALVVSGRGDLDHSAYFLTYGDRAK
jgi:2-hydroxy-3-oxopropionate reductase